MNTTTSNRIALRGTTIVAAPVVVQLPVLVLVSLTREVWDPT